MPHTYDQYLGELSVALFDRATERLGGEERTSSRALLSAGIVSAHWLLSDDDAVHAFVAPPLSQIMRVRFAAGDAIDRDALEWIVGVCTLLLGAAYLLVGDREAVIREVADALDLGDALLDAACEIWSASTEALTYSPEGVTPQIARARELIVEGCSLDDVGVLDPLMLLILVGKFRSFFEDAIRS